MCGDMRSSEVGLVCCWETKYICCSLLLRAGTAPWSSLSGEFPILVQSVSSSPIGLRYHSKGQHNVNPYPGNTIGRDPIRGKRCSQIFHDNIPKLMKTSVSSILLLERPRSGRRVSTMSSAAGKKGHLLITWGGSHTSDAAATEWPLTI